MRATRMLMTMQGKRALVTGAGKGIGRGLVDELCNRGATVYALTRSQKDLDDIVKDHPTAVPLKCDLSDTDQIKSVLKDIDAPHMVVNNAGITNLQPFLETDVKEWDEVMDVNVKSIMVVSQVCAKKMIEEKIAGSIVNLSSMGAEIGLANHTAYCTSKGAVNQLTRVMALELGAHGIRTNCVQPTIVFTQMGRLAWSDPVKNRPMRERIPLGKFCEVEDVVNPVMFLLSDEAAMINGAMIPIEGGFLASPFSLVTDEE
mmetsp:Transcript_38011/g.73634  ORF Transcript_38011/g.73634 Transcript_38011/m.73634 type:complete len:259 (-) Transcript_38011:189-965(-)